MKRHERKLEIIKAAAENLGLESSLEDELLSQAAAIAIDYRPEECRLSIGLSTGAAIRIRGSEYDLENLGCSVFDPKSKRWRFVEESDLSEIIFDESADYRATAAALVVEESDLPEIIFDESADYRAAAAALAELEKLSGANSVSCDHAEQLKHRN